MADERSTAWRTVKTGNPGGEFRSRTRQASDEFSRFQRLTRKLVRLPKSELDEKREKS